MKKIIVIVVALLVLLLLLQFIEQLTVMHNLSGTNGSTDAHTVR